MSIHFYDAATPSNVPSGVYAAVAIDGDFAWADHDILRMHKVIRYTVLGGREVAHRARGIDIETGNRANDPDFYIPFLLERQRHYGDATPYVNRSNRPIVDGHCRAAGLSVGKLFWWVSTLDGTIVPGAWASQLHDTGKVDISILQGVDDFHRP